MRNIRRAEILDRVVRKGLMRRWCVCKTPKAEKDQGVQRPWCVTQPARKARLTERGVGVTGCREQMLR